VQKEKPQISSQMKSRKAISTLLTFFMFFTLTFNNVGVFASETSNDRKVDIWDFGGIQTSGDLYNNHITAEVLWSATIIMQSKNTLV
jgi:hypothetical protein